MKKNWFCFLAACLLLSLELCLLLDAVLAFLSIYTSPVRFAVCCAGILAVIFGISVIIHRTPIAALIISTLILAAAAAGIQFFRNSCRSEEYVKNLQYKQVDGGKDKLFGGEKRSC